MNLAGKIILIVGGATGIGRATARLCAERGAQVIIADRNAAEGTSAAAQAGGRFFPVDVTDEASVSALYQNIEHAYGQLHVLLHTAGVLKGAYVPLEAFDLDTWQTVLAVNATGSFLCARHAVPLLKKTGGGVIVLVSSGAATGGSSSFAYGSSKGAVNSLAIVLANALAQDNIRVNVVSPGNIDTPMKRSVIAAEVERRRPYSGAEPENFEQTVAQARLGTPDGVAKVLAWLASDEADYVRGIISTR